VFYNWRIQNCRLFYYLFELVIICWNGVCCTVGAAHDGFRVRWGTHSSVYTFIVIARFTNAIWENKRDNMC
jgi:hypothetical protein